MIINIKRHWKQLVLLILLVIIAYFNGLNNAFVSDDVRVIPQNPGLADINFIFANPLSSLRLILYFLAFKIGGFNPVLYRLINVFFHIGNVFLVYILLTYLSRIHNHFIKRFTPLLVASIFAIHPILVESVTWISGGSYAQNGFFSLLTFLFYLLSKNTRWFYFLSLIAYLFILGSAPHAIVLPIVLVIYEISLGNIKKYFKKIMPLLILLGVLAVSYFFQLSQRMTALVTEYSQAKGTDNIFIKIPVAINSYLQLIFWPSKLTLYHSELFFTKFEYLIQLFFFLVFVIMILITFKKNRMLFFWLGFFVITLLPTLTPLRIAWIVAERYVYLGSLGIFVSVILPFQKYFEKRKYRRVAYIVSGVIAILLISRTIIRNIDWKNEDALWLATAKTSPSSPNNHNNLGDLYSRQANLKASVEEFKKAIELDPTYADPHHNLALTYEQMGQLDLAIEYYQKAIKLKPSLWQSYQNLTAIYYYKKDYEKAYQFINKAIELSPKNANLYVTLGIMYYQQGKKTEAKKAFEKAVEFDPQNQKALIGLDKID